MHAIRSLFACRTHSGIILGTRAAVVTALVAGSLFFAAVADAHKPVLARAPGSSFATATWISDPAISWAIYATLEKPMGVDYYTFEARRGEDLYAQILVPKLNGLLDFRPTLMLVGPALIQPNAALPVQLPPQAGAVVVEPPGLGDSSEFFVTLNTTTVFCHSDSPQARKNPRPGVRILPRLGRVRMTDEGPHSDDVLAELRL